MFENKFQVIENLKSNPDNYDFNLKLGMIYINENNYSEAKIIFKNLISLNHKRYEGFLNLSNVQFEPPKIFTPRR